MTRAYLVHCMNTRPLVLFAALDTAGIRVHGVYWSRRHHSSPGARMPDETEVAQAELAAQAAVAIAATTAEAETAQAAVEAQAQVATAQLIHDTAASEAAALVAVSELRAELATVAAQVVALEQRMTTHDSAQEDAIDDLVESISEMEQEQDAPVEAPTPIAAAPEPEPPQHPVISPRPVLARLSPREQRKLRRRKR